MPVLILTCSGEPHVVSDSKPLSATPMQVDSKLEYGMASHVSHTVRKVDEAKKGFLTRNWKTCKNDKEVSAWIEGLTLSKANRAKLATWTARVQKWHSDSRRTRDSSSIRRVDLHQAQRRIGTVGQIHGYIEVE